MTAEVLDAGTLTVGAVCALVVVVAGGAMSWANLRSSIRDLARLLRGEPGERKGSVLHRLDELESEAQEHRHGDRTSFHHQELRIGRLESVLEREGLITGVRDTGPHPATPPRRRPPDPGESR